MRIRWKKKIDLVHRAGYTIVVPASEVQSRLKELLESASPTAEVTGFRRGKAPMKLLLRAIGPKRVEKELRQALHREAFDQLIRETKSKPVGPPAIDDGDLHFDRDYSFTVNFAKEVGAITPSHERHVPVIGDLSGSAMNVHQRMYSEAFERGRDRDYIPDDLAAAMPDRVMNDSKSKLHDFRNPLRADRRYEPSPGDTDATRKITRTTEPNELIKDLPHKALDEKARPPDKPLEERLPETEYKESIDLELPTIVDPRQSDELQQEIKTPSQASSDTRPARDPLKEAEETRKETDDD
jgi:hypothetical protein